jgi:hypothetical protein
MTLIRNSQANKQTLALDSLPCQPLVNSEEKNRFSVDRMERSSQV